MQQQNKRKSRRTSWLLGALTLAALFCTMPLLGCDTSDEGYDNYDEIDDKVKKEVEGNVKQNKDELEETAEEPITETDEPAKEEQPVSQVTGETPAWIAVAPPVAEHSTTFVDYAAVPSAPETGNTGLNNVELEQSKEVPHSFHSWSKFAWTHKELGNHYDYKCTIGGETRTFKHYGAQRKNEEKHWMECPCGGKWGESEHSYTVDDGWASSKTEHYLVCAICGEIPGTREKHMFIWEMVDETNHLGVCNACYMESELETHVYDNETAARCDKCWYLRFDPVTPETPGAPDNTKEPDTSGMPQTPGALPN